MAEIVALCICTACFGSICFCCFKCCKSMFGYQNVPVYSAPVILTSQSHQPPGSQYTTTGFPPRSPSPAFGPSTSYPSGGYMAPGPQMQLSAPYPPMNAGSPYPPQASFPQQMPLPSNLPYPPNTMYPPQEGQNITQRSNVLQPSAPYPTSPPFQDMDVPPNYNDAMTNFSNEQKRF